MDRFRGHSGHTIDPKGRIIIPVRFRQVLMKRGGEGLMVSTLDGAVMAYPYDKWAELEDAIVAQAKKSETMRRFRRVFIGGAVDCPWDKQGRILIPPEHRVYARLEKDIVLAGALDHFEIWDRERWEAENRLMVEEDMNKEEVRNEIAELGL